MPLIVKSNGRSYEKLTEKRWRTSKLERPHSASRFALSCGKFGSPALVKNPDASSIDLPERVGDEHRAAERIALLEARLQAVEFRPRARLDERDVGKPRIRPQIQLRRARPRLIDVTRGNQIAAARSDVPHLGHASRAQLPLQRDVELVQERRAQIALKPERRIRRRNREVRSGTDRVNVTSPSGEVKYAAKLKYGALKYSPSLGASAEWL